MEIFNKVISWVIKKRIHQIELFVKYPYDVQQEWLKRLMSDAAHTEFGKKYGFSSINNYQIFKEQVPIFDYESLYPYIDRIRKGEQNILWHTEIKWFAKSSGTTNDKSKYIPVSQESLEDCHYKGGKDLLSIYCNNNPNTTIFDGKGLAIGGSQDHTYDTDFFYGDLSAIILQNLPFWVRFIQTPSLSIALMENWEYKLDQLAKATISENVTNLSGVPSWTLLLVKKVLEITGEDNLLNVWPNLELFAHGGTHFSPYKSLFEQYIPSDTMSYLNTYNATEGFFGIQDQSRSDEMLLMLDYGIYYEFIPMEHIDDEHPKTLSLEEVDLDKNYALVISTNAGLWRYKIGDTIMFTNLSPYRFRITGRIKSYINAFGEELIRDNAEQALQLACDKTNAIINEFTAAPIYIDKDKSGAHEWLIEFEKQPNDLGHFTEILDNALKSINSDYEAKRYHNLILREPVIKSLPKNTFYNWLKSKGKLGGQNKVPRLCNDRKHVEQLLEMIENMTVEN